MWDGPILPAFGNNAPTCNQPQSGWFITWGGPAPGQTVTWTNWWADPDMGFDENQVAPPATNMSYNLLDATSPNWVGHVNIDGGDTDFPWAMDLVGFQRYRHMGNTSANFLYFDGHVEAKKIGEVLYRDLSIFPF
jgi:prepilin-type processing-associated H-X9-DG protein